MARCARCGELIEAGEAFDLDHTDDRAGYLGASHQACNRGAPSGIGRGGCRGDGEFGDYPVYGPRDGELRLVELASPSCASAVLGIVLDVGRGPRPGVLSSWDAGYGRHLQGWGRCGGFRPCPH